MTDFNPTPESTMSTEETKKSICQHCGVSMPTYGYCTRCGMMNERPAHQPATDTAREAAEEFCNVITTKITDILIGHASADFDWKPVIQKFLDDSTDALRREVEELKRSQYKLKGESDGQILHLGKRVEEARREVEGLRAERETLKANRHHANERALELAAQLDAVTKERDEARKDTARLDWMNSRQAYISHSRDGEVCNVWYRWDDEGQDGGPVQGYPQKCYYDYREAIDAATGEAKGGAEG